MESTLLTSETHTLVHVEDHLWCSQSVQLVIFFFFYCFKEQRNHALLVFSIRQKVPEISRDFQFWWFYNYLCCSISLCLFCSFDGISEVAVCNQVNSQISFQLGKIAFSLNAKPSNFSGIAATTRISAMRSTTFDVFSFEVHVFSSFELGISIAASLFLRAMDTYPSALNRVKGTLERGWFNASSQLIIGEAFRKLQLQPRVNDLQTKKLMSDESDECLLWK